MLFAALRFRQNGILNKMAQNGPELMKDNKVLSCSPKSDWQTYSTTLVPLNQLLLLPSLPLVAF